MNNKKKCINIIAYIIVVILAVFYLATLVLGSKLDVSDEYKLYYVDGELSKWPGENGLDYYFGIQRYMIYQSLKNIKSY